MPRAPRIDVPNIPYHIVNRGIRKSPLFHDVEDRLEFLDCLKVTRLRYPVDVEQYSLMTNHFHLLLRPLETSLSMVMQYFASRFASWFNRKYKSSGHLFQGRFHSIPVDEANYYMRVSSYIHLNAPRAGIVLRPEDYRWSNYENLVGGVADPVASGGLILNYFGNDPIQQRLRYKAFVEDSLKREEPVTHETLMKMRSWGRLPVLPPRHIR